MLPDHRRDPLDRRFFPILLRFHGTDNLLLPPTQNNVNYCSHVSYCSYNTYFFLLLSHRTLAALFAISLLLLAVNFAARAGPPLKPPR